MGAKKYLRVESGLSDADLDVAGGQSVHAEGAEPSVEYYNYSLWRAVKSL